VRNKLLARLAIGVVVTGSLLAPQEASAVDFTFTFFEVTGLIENLVEGQNTCNNAAPNSPACFVTVTNSGGSSAGVGIYTHDVGVANFIVGRSGGSFIMKSADWEGRNNPINNGRLIFCEPGVFRQACPNPMTSQPLGILESANNDPNDRPQQILVKFAAVQPPTPSSTSVPGPLPLFGAAAAFGFSRKLRNRIKKSGNSAASTFTLVGR